MRTSLVPSLLRNAARNLRQRVTDVRLYEIASVYRSLPPGFTSDVPAAEDMRLAGVALGRRHPAGWAAGNEALDFADLKRHWRAPWRRSGSRAWLEGGRGAVDAPALGQLHRGGKRGIDRPGGGAAGEVHPRVAAAFELPAGVYAFEMSFEALAHRARLVPAYRSVPRFPAVLRDLAVVVDERVLAEAVLALVREEPLVETVTLFDVYRGPPVPEGRKSLASPSVTARPTAPSPTPRPTRRTAASWRGSGPIRPHGRGARRLAPASVPVRSRKHPGCERNSQAADLTGPFRSAKNCQDLGQHSASEAT